MSRKPGSIVFFLELPLPFFCGRFGPLQPLEYTTRALVFSDGRLIADAAPAAVLCDSGLVERAALKETSLFALASLCGIDEPVRFVERFIETDREVRSRGR